MEFTFLPKTTHRHKTFVRYSINSQVVPEESVYNKSGFFYIGKNSANIEKLVKIFKRGYASEGIDNAKSELMRSLMLEKNNIPEIIFCETHFDLAAIRSFCLYINNHAAFSSIPFVLDASQLDKAEMSQFRKTKLADEIIFLNDLDENSLMAKIQFLKKVKTKVAGLETLAKTERRFLSNFNAANLVKRVFDIVVSSVALFLLSPIFLLIALAINIESRGPVFYIAKRAGRGYRIFNFYKFRTMYTGADKMISEFSHLNQYNASVTDGPPRYPGWRFLKEQQPG
jgi:Bacterial sugar transferase